MKLWIALASVLFLPATLFAWGVDGHQIVCLIAEERLTPASKNAIRELLGGANISDAAVASWADDIRQERSETGPWHYVDIPVDAKGFDERLDGKRGNNVIDKIGDFVKILSDRNALREKRAEALKFLVHFVGDVHQPLHCADRNHDSSGNRRLVFFLDQPRATNLHAVWDSSILNHHKDATRILRYAQALNTKITNKEEKDWSKGTSREWANESHDIAAKVAYAGVPADGPPPRLDEAYVNRAAIVVDQQLQKGGVRLANLLNQCFAD